MNLSKGTTDREEGERDQRAEKIARVREPGWSRAKTKRRQVRESEREDAAKRIERKRTEGNGATAKQRVARSRASRV